MHAIYCRMSQFFSELRQFLSAMSVPSFMTYYRLLNVPGPKNWFILPWAQIVIRNYHQGHLVCYKNLREYKKKKRPKWVLCCLVVFKDTNTSDIFPIFNCTTCEKMNGIENLRIKQDRANIESLKCVHSLMCDKLVREGFSFRD